MKPATVKQIKDELKNKTPGELMELCLYLSKFKKENKEILTYLLFEADNEDGYISSVKEELDEQFSEMNVSSYYFMKKTCRKILRGVKKHIRYSKKKETEIELLLYFCYRMRHMTPSFEYNTVLKNMFNRQIELIQKRMEQIHEDLRYDYQVEIETLL